MSNVTATVKMNDKVIIPAKEFFRSSYATLDLYSQLEIETMKQAIKDRHNGNNVEFFSNDGIEFFTYTILEENLTTINMVKDGGTLSGGDLWKFGYVTPSGEITMLFGNQYVAKGRKDAIKLFEKVQMTYSQYGKPFANKS